MHLASIRDRLRNSLWLVPAIFGLGAVVLASVIVRLERHVTNATLIGFGGGAESARSVLATVAASTITFAGLVFSITIVALQLASTQYSPRVLRTFMRDRVSKMALGVTIGTFTYSLLVLQSVRTDGPDGEFVPSIGVSAALVFALIAVGTFIAYMAHISHSIQVSTILDSVADETIATVRRSSERAVCTPPPAPEWTTDMRARRDGVVVAIDGSRLAEIAGSTGCIIDVRVAVGDPILEDMAMMRSSSPLTRDRVDEALRSIELGSDRSLQQDFAFGLRQLVDIADRALSPGINDPTTAVQALDRIHAVLRRLAPLPLGVRWVCDEHGEPRVSIRGPSWEDLVSLSVDEIRLSGGGRLQISRRLHAMFDDLEAVTEGTRRLAIVRESQLLDASDSRSFIDRQDLGSARRADGQGLGATRD